MEEKKDEKDENYLSPKTVQILKDTYYNPSDFGSFGSVQNLFKSAKKKFPSLSMHDTVLWLSGQSAYTKHRRVSKKHFLRRKVVALGIMDVFCCDLIDAQSIKNVNSGFAYILSIVDLFSRFAFVKKLRKKTTIEVGAAFEDVFNEIKDVPLAIWSDRGSELTSLSQKIFKEFGIRHYFVDSPLHATVVERFNKTYEIKLFKTMTARNSLRYIDFMQDIVDGINNRPSRALFGATPKEVFTNRSKQEWLRKKMEHSFGLHSKIAEKQSQRPPFFKVGDFVRVRLKPKKFERSYEPRYSDTVYKLVHKLNTTPATWKLSGLKRSYYKEEMVPVKKRPENEASLYDFVERSREVGGTTLRSGKRRNTEKQYLKKNLNDPAISTWISEHEREKIK